MIWIITDTHFGHNNIITLCGRPRNYEDLIIKSWKDNVDLSDTIIHIGDIRFGRNSEHWDYKIQELPGIKILVKGNHDRNSNRRYTEELGWALVVEALQIQTEFGQLLITHRPATAGDWDINLHGHCHNGEETIDDGRKRILFALEYDGYKVQLLNQFLQKKIKCRR